MVSTINKIFAGAASVAMVSTFLTATNCFADYAASEQSTVSDLCNKYIVGYNANTNSRAIPDDIACINITTCVYNNSNRSYAISDGGVYMSQNSDLLFNKNIEKLNEMLKLEDNWDDDGAKAFNKSLIANVKHLLSTLDSLQPNIFPTPNAKVQLEFYDQNNYLELVVSENDCELYITDSINLDKDVFDKFDFDEKRIASIVKSFFCSTQRGDS